MNILLKNVKIVDSKSSFNGKKKDIGIVNGKITFDIKNNKFSKETDLKGATVCPGFMDLRAFMGEPGIEYKEDFNSFQNAAKRGGFTSVAILPNTYPVIDNKDILKNIINQSKDEVVNIYPLAALSKEAKGEELSEMIDLHNNGAIAFTDGHNPIYHSDLILKGLQYGKSIDTLIINTPVDYHLSKKGYVNEGVNGTQLGMPGIPHLAEELAIERDLKLLEYAGGRMHFSLITTEKGIDLIRKAKKKGLNVTCDVAAHYLVYDDEVLNDFDSNQKVFPPYRTQKDIKALLRGVVDGTIDAIVSDHRPENIENKKLEFDKAEFGISSIETTFSLLCNNTNLTEELIIEKLTSGPRQVLRLPDIEIEENTLANLTIVDFDKTWVVNLVSKSKNNSLIGKELKGRVLGVINGNKNWMNEN